MILYVKTEQNCRRHNLFETFKLSLRRRKHNVHRDLIFLKTSDIDTKYAPVKLTISTRKSIDVVAMFSLLPWNNSSASFKLNDLVLLFLILTVFILISLLFAYCWVYLIVDIMLIYNIHNMVVYPLGSRIKFRG